MMQNSAGYSNSPIFSISRLSPYLSPLMDHNPRKSSLDQNELMNFDLGRAESHDQMQDPEIEMDEDYSDDFPLRENSITKLKLQYEMEMRDQDQSVERVSEEIIGAEIQGQQNFDSQSRIENLIVFLVENSATNEDSLVQESRIYTNGSKQFTEVFTILVRKFRKLKKTKEQMTKYCMRKAFKFISDKIRSERTGGKISSSKDIDACLKLYFSKNSGNEHSFSIPFKKNSSEKTMNSAFLKKIFSSKSFLADYHTFLVEFQALIRQDNVKKIKYLAEMVEEYMKTNSIKKIQTIKRLPWTRQILKKTEQLGYALLAHSEEQKQSESPERE